MFCEAFGTPRTNTCRNQRSEVLPIRVDTPAVIEHEEIGQGDNLTFESFDLRYVGDLSAAVGQPRDLNDQIDRRADLFTNGPHREF